MSKLIYGVGISDGQSVVGGVKCPYHQRWRDMLKRCYSEKYLLSKPSYVGCYVCDDWLTFSKFKAWMEKQDWEGNALDKDLLVEGNKEYSPDNCLFVSNEVNQFINTGGKNNGLLMGVSWLPNKNRFLSQSGNKRGSAYIGLFLTESAAHNAYRKRKYEQACELSERQTNNVVAEALVKRYKLEV